MYRGKMKKKLNTLLAIMLLVVSALVFLPTQEMTVYADSDTISTNLLINGDTTYSSNADVGSAWGYGKFILDARDVTIGTSANAGYSLVGWRIKDEAETVTLITKDAVADDIITFREVREDGGLVITQVDGSVTYTMTYTDVAKDGYYEAGSFTISNIAESLTVTPVYDHIYYSVDVTSFANIVDFNNQDEWNTLTLGSQTVLTKAIVEDGLYQNAFLKEGDKIYYVGDVYSNGAYFYTKHSTLESTPSVQSVDLSRGAFRLGEHVNIDFEVGFDYDNLTTDSINALVTGVKLDNNVMNSSTTDGYSVTNHDTYKNTTAVAVDFTISREDADSNVDTNVLTVDYNNLYVVTFNAKVDDVIIDSTFEEYNLIINSITAHNTLPNSNLGNDKYFIVEGDELRIVASQTVTKLVDGSNYNYYSFTSLEGETVKERNYDEATGNITVNIEYSSIEYAVEFKFVLKNGNNYSNEVGEFNLEETLYLKRGESSTITRTLVEGSTTKYISDNLGYRFYGFAYNTLTVTENASISVSIDSAKPSGTTILMVYTEIDYKLELAGFDRITLDNSGDTIYPISLAKLIYGGQEYQLDGSILRTASERTYPLTDGGSKNLKTIAFSDAIININDTITISLTLNKGFNIIGFKYNINDITYVANSHVANFVITPQLLANVADGETPTIMLVVEESYTEYSFEYYIEESTDENFDHKVVMADIDIDIDSLSHVTKTYQYAYTSYTYDEADWNANYNKYYIYIDNNYVLNTNNVYNSEEDYFVQGRKTKVLLSGLHLYDNIALASTPYSVIDAGRELNYTYLFIRYTENNMTDLSPITSTGTSYSYEADILKDNTRIKVVYSIPHTQLRVSLSHAGAYDMSNLLISIGGNAITPTTENGDSYYLIEEQGEITVAIDSTNSGNVIAFGYALTGYTMTIDGSNRITTTTEYTYTFNITSSSVHYLTINFKMLEYRFVVEQSGAGKDGEVINFDNDGVTQAYKSANIEGVEFDIDIPLGYYVGVVYYLEGEDRYIEQTSLAQDNDYEGNTYSYINSGEEYINMLKAYAKLDDDEGCYIMTIKLEYVIHTYDAIIQFVITNPKNNSADYKITTPEFNISYLYNSEYLTFDGVLVLGQDRQVIFADIPYGVNIEINLVSPVRKGMKYEGWRFGDGSLLVDYIYSETKLEAGAGNIVNQDMNFMYRWSYQEYDIRVEIANGDASMGDPELSINNVVNEHSKNSGKLTLFDNIRIDAKENKGNGYVFNRYFYYADVYEQYSYNTEDWNKNYAKYYTQVNGSYIINTDSNYDEAKTYYTFVEDYLVEVTDSSYFSSEFDIINYKLTNGNKVVIYVEYKEFRVSILPRSAVEGKYTLNKGDLSISVNDYANYTIKAINKDTNEERTLTATDTVTHKDYITIIMQFNTVTLDEVEYNLSHGVSFVGISVQGIEVDNQGDTVIVNFDMGQHISNAESDGSFNIIFKFMVKEITITSTTNITDDSFYYDDVAGVKFYTSYDNTVYNFDGVGGSNGYSSCNNKSHFLTKTKLSYSHNSLSGYRLHYDGYAYYFYVGSVRIYSGLDKARELSSSELADLGVVITYADATFNDGKVIKVVDSIDVRMTTNLYVEYQVSAVMYFDTDKRDNNGAIVFETEYECDKDANGISQWLTIGTADTDILAADIIVSNLQELVYYKEIETNASGSSSFEYIRTDYPTDAGKYLVGLAFKPDTSLAWLNAVKLNYVVYLQILPKAVTLTYMQSTTNYEKPYDGSSLFWDDTLMSRLMITDNGILTMMLWNSEFKLRDGYKNSVTITETTLEGEANVHNASLVAYNLYWTNLSLDNTLPFNSNFKLTTSTLKMLNVIKINRAQLQLTGLALRDKVYDGTNIGYLATDAEVGLRGIVNEGEVGLELSRLEIKYSDDKIGANKKVTISAKNALIGNVSNYYINDEQLSSSIYPYSVKANIEGLGEVILENRAGLTETSKVKTIPIGATLVITTIYKDTPEYVAIYENIAEYVNSENIFAIGYSLNFLVDGVINKVSKDLYLIVPNVNRLISAIWNTGEVVGELE